MRGTNAPHSLTSHGLTITHRDITAFSLNYQLYNLLSIIHPYSFVSHTDCYKKQLEASRPKYGFAVLKDLKKEREIPQKKANTDAESPDVNSRRN
jgi:hypothetical protein